MSPRWRIVYYERKRERAPLFLSKNRHRGIDARGGHNIERKGGDRARGRERENFGKISTRRRRRRRRNDYQFRPRVGPAEQSAAAAAAVVIYNNMLIGTRGRIPGGERAAIDLFVSCFVLLCCCCPFVCLSHSTTTTTRHRLDLLGQIAGRRRATRRREMCTDLASALDALVGMFRLEADAGRREALLVPVDVAVVQTGGRAGSGDVGRGSRRSGRAFRRVERPKWSR